jgi:hypothetical protein
MAFTQIPIGKKTMLRILLLLILYTPTARADDNSAFFGAVF